MAHIHKKTLHDIEFPKVLQQISDYCLTAPGTERVLAIEPFSTFEECIASLYATNEYLASLQSENRIPNHFFEPIANELKLLKIGNSTLQTAGFVKLAALSQTAIEILVFLKKFEDYYPTLAKNSAAIEVTKVFIEKIRSVIDRFGEVRDDATAELARIRKEIFVVRGKINQSFIAALSHYVSLDYLDDIKESVVENKRVLAVKAMYRRKVSGTVLGSSKTGSIVYMEPESTLRFSRELNNLEYEEQEEIKHILKVLTEFVRPYTSLIDNYQSFLTEMDLISAKAKYSNDINAVLPNINQERLYELKDAYHPLLFVANNKKKIKTFPQSVVMDQEKRIIIISGPNAGGKSITLKTVGLLQTMLQSGILIPVHEKSNICFFERILTDIGDNQSVENHLSTYSYRLKQMNYFLKKCNKDTLFLIDEFGTGSDPELGGALAETFLEEFYHRGAYGVITTHYANLKLLANELPHIQNASMLFDEGSLEPMFRLVIGQAGSSFTFEVAQKNGIPFSLINRAKKKIERGKVRFDATIAKLQKERSKLEKTERSLKENAMKTKTQADKLEETNQKIQKKLESYQELYDSNQRLIYLGQKLDDLSEKYLNNKRKKELFDEVFKLVQIENSKRKKTTSAQKKVQTQKSQKLKQEVEKAVEAIRQKKKTTKLAAQTVEKPKPILKVGDRVRLLDGKAVGSIDKIEKNKAVVNYGLFTTNASIEQLELVETAK